MKRLLLSLAALSFLSVPLRASVEERSIAYVLVDLSDLKASDQYTLEDVSAEADHVRKVFLQDSYDQQVFNNDLDDDGLNDVFYTSVNYPGAKKCGHGKWRDEAVANLLATGVDLKQYRNVVFVVPSHAKCPWVGMSTGPSDCRKGPCYSWVLGIQKGLTVHEIAHTLGLEHSGSDPKDKAGIPKEELGPTDLFNDPTDPMGTGFYDKMFNAPNMIRAKWLSGRHVVDITTSGRYRITSQHIHKKWGRVQTLVLPRTEKTKYYLAYRVARGADALLKSEYRAGVLLYSYPYAGASKFIQVLKDGETRQLHGFSVTQVRHNDRSVVIDIQFQSEPTK